MMMMMMMMMMMTTVMVPRREKSSSHRPLLVFVLKLKDLPPQVRRAAAHGVFIIERTHRRGVGKRQTQNRVV